MAIGAPFLLDLRFWRVAEGDFKIRGLKPLPPPSLELLCVSSGANLETNGSHRGTCVSLGSHTSPLLNGFYMK